MATVRVQRDAGPRHPRDASGPAHPAQPHRHRDTSSPTCASGSSSWRRSSPTRAAAQRSSRTEMTRDQGRSSPRRASARSTSTIGEMTDLDLVDDKELVIVMTEAQYVKTVDGRQLQDPGSRRSRCQRRQAEDRRHRPPRHLHHGSRLPAVLQQPRPGLSPARHGHPRARANRQGHADRQPAAAAAGRDHPGDHRHPRLRRRAQPVLRHPPGRGQEDLVPRVRQRSARRARSPSTCATATSWCGSSRPAATTTSSWSAARA